jgi:hypothetical protein
MKYSIPIAAAASLAGCMPHPAPPPAPSPALYHAAGKDSLWDLVIDDRNITFIPAGEQPIVQRKPPVIVGIAGEIYQTPRINVNIVHAQCVIGDRTFPDRVQVYVDQVQHTGCGGL